MPRVGRRASGVVLAFRFENAATPEPRDRHGEFSDKEPAPYGWNNTKSLPRDTLSLRISSKKALRKRHTGVRFRKKDRNSLRIFRVKSSTGAVGAFSRFSTGFRDRFESPTVFLFFGVCFHEISGWPCIPYNTLRAPTDSEGLPETSAKSPRRHLADGAAIGGELR